MHLKALTLRGFKSFASATTLRFEPGITCVVGPNGSGKSNVVDALNWVMGEQGAKSLRGGKMEDVVFAGTADRPPLGRAEVSLTIDNADGALPIEYAEVTITRVMFRNGGSEYQINGDTCRLLDVQELLSDSGIGREMHVIVGQGRLDSVLRADPMGRRAFIEEAAGVLKHRKRKEKALRKLDAMQANLARVRDLTEELRRRLKPLGRQAAVARRAATIQADLRDARLRLLADDLVRLREALRAEIADEAALKERKNAAERALAEARHREERWEAEVRELGPRSRQSQLHWHELSRLAERVRGTVSLAEARFDRASAEPPEERRGRDPEDLEAEAARIREREVESQTALEAARRALGDAVSHRAELEEELAGEERRLKDAARADADRREGLARLEGQVAAARSRAAAAGAEVERLAATRDEGHARAAAARAEHEEWRVRVAALDAEHAGLAASREAAEERLDAARRSLESAREAGTEAERRHAAARARHEALSLALRRQDGTPALLSAGDRLTGVLGPVADLLRVEPGHETSLAAALDAAAEAVAVRGLGPAVDALRALRKDDAGRVVLLLAGEAVDDAPAVVVPAGLRSAADLVRGPVELMPAVRRLLGRTVVVDTLAEAEEVVRARPALTAVTSEGDVLGSLLARGGAAREPGLLELRACLEETDAELVELAARREGLADARTAAERSFRERATSVAELGERIRVADRERAAADQRLARLAGQVRGADDESDRARGAADRARRDLERARQEAEELAERLAVAEELPTEEEPDTSRRERLAAAGADARHVEMEARLQLRTHEERAKALAGRADALDRAARGEREVRARAEGRRARLRAEAAVAEAVTEGARRLLVCAQASADRADAERVAAEEAEADAERELVAARTAARQARAELDSLTDSVHRGEVLGAEKRLRVAQLETKALEEMGVEPDSLVADYGPGQPVPAPASEGSDDRGSTAEHGADASRPFVRAEQEERLRAAERAYQRLGKVNPLALEEFAALEERHRFLGEQLDDLKKTRADLLRVVREVDERVERVFAEAFADTAREFEGVFGRLFPGGEGRLVLTDPDDLLHTGVDVEARPPGKKVRRLSLLSGGERSLTAVALLVSIFKARPSPFYVMDEVEAALDDTNLRRLIRIMRELREVSQLIVITHQKRTMEVADALYGVSMRGDGVSKVIGQRLR
ncbi:chromosome segregation protein SMC [Streptomyces sp. HSG2]|uniref:chromosome segregation protein SMC n=1 Tax=Streptomyces sp. HSG2 TaxID=2797167 RepID=UPI001907AFCB|nr:chromosome segregation protein SMC [Streptomyces sp. HSG2]